MGVRLDHCFLIIFNPREDYISAIQWKSRGELACLIKLSFYNHPFEEHVLKFYTFHITS